mmetsp:Transcript_49168/g.152623  ORF Transcript_49168/g.152623 Transcript_49168/m.152623 type:complete len:641 (+) Transcript_49168:123-2045(+)
MPPCARRGCHIRRLRRGPRTPDQKPCIVACPTLSGWGEGLRRPARQRPRRQRRAPASTPWGPGGPRRRRSTLMASSRLQVHLAVALVDQQVGGGLLRGHLSWLNLAHNGIIIQVPLRVVTHHCGVVASVGRVAVVADQRSHPVLDRRSALGEPAAVEHDLLIVLHCLLELLRAALSAVVGEPLEVQDEDLRQGLELHAPRGLALVHRFRVAEGLQRRPDRGHGGLRDVQVQMVAGLQGHAVGLRPPGAHDAPDQAAKDARHGRVLVQPSGPRLGPPLAGLDQVRPLAGRLLLGPLLRARSASRGQGGGGPLALVVEPAQKVEEELRGILLSSKSLPARYHVLDPGQREHVHRLAGRARRVGLAAVELPADPRQAGVERALGVALSALGEDPHERAALQQGLDRDVHVAVVGVVPNPEAAVGCPSGVVHLRAEAALKPSKVLRRGQSAVGLGVPLARQEDEEVQEAVPLRGVERTARRAVAGSGVLRIARGGLLPAGASGHALRPGLRGLVGRGSVAFRLAGALAVRGGPGRAAAALQGLLAGARAVAGAGGGPTTSARSGLLGRAAGRRAAVGVHVGGRWLEAPPLRGPALGGPCGVSLAGRLGMAGVRGGTCGRLRLRSAHHPWGGDTGQDISAQPSVP